MTAGDIERIGQYMQAREAAQKTGAVTKLWSIYSGNVPDGEVGSRIAEVRWYSPWRRYVVEGLLGTLFDPECLRALADFCERKTNEHKAKRKEGVT